MGSGTGVENPLERFGHAASQKEFVYAKVNEINEKVHTHYIYIHLTIITCTHDILTYIHTPTLTGNCNCKKQRGRRTTFR